MIKLSTKTRLNRSNRNDRVAQLRKRCSLGLIKSGQVQVDLLLGHIGILKVGAEGVKVGPGLLSRN